MEDLYEMQYNDAFYQGLHCLLRFKQPSGTEIYHNLESSTWTPSKAQWAVPYLLYQYEWEFPPEYNGLTCDLFVPCVYMYYTGFAQA